MCFLFETSLLGLLVFAFRSKFALQKRPKPKIPSETCRELPIDPVGFCQPICLGNLLLPPKIGRNMMIPQPILTTCASSFSFNSWLAQTKKTPPYKCSSFPLPGEILKPPKSQIPPVGPSKKTSKIPNSQGNGKVEWISSKFGTTNPVEVRHGRQKGGCFFGGWLGRFLEMLKFSPIKEARWFFQNFLVEIFGGAHLLLEKIHVFFGVLKSEKGFSGSNQLEA